MSMPQHSYICPLQLQPAMLRSVALSVPCAYMRANPIMVFTPPVAATYHTYLPHQHTSPTHLVFVRYKSLCEGRNVG